MLRSSVAVSFAFCQVCLAAPGFWAPSGPPPWVPPSAGSSKRRCVAAQPTSTEVTSSSSRSAMPFPEYPGAGGTRSLSEMAQHSSNTHMVLDDWLHNARGATSVHSELGVSWTRGSNPRVVAPPPLEVMKLLREQATQGANIGYLLDQVARARAAFSVRDSSRAMYSSHLRCIVAVCDALQEPVVPANLRMLRRYTAVCNNPVTWTPSCLAAPPHCIRRTVGWTKLPTNHGRTGGINEAPASQDRAHGHSQGTHASNRDRLPRVVTERLGLVRNNGRACLVVRATSSIRASTAMDAWDAKNMWSCLELWPNPPQEHGTRCDSPACMCMPIQVQALMPTQLGWSLGTPRGAWWNFNSILDGDAFQ